MLHQGGTRPGGIRGGEKGLRGREDRLGGTHQADQGGAGRQGRESDRLQPHHRFTLRARDRRVGLECVHGEDHEGAGPA